MALIGNFCWLAQPERRVSKICIFCSQDFFRASILSLTEVTHYRHKGTQAKCCSSLKWLFLLCASLSPPISLSPYLSLSVSLTLCLTYTLTLTISLSLPLTHTLSLSNTRSLSRKQTQLLSLVPLKTCLFSFFGEWVCLSLNVIMMLPPKTFLLLFRNQKRFFLFEQNFNLTDI